MTRPSHLLALPAILGALLLAGCGGSGSSTTTTGTTSAPSGTQGASQAALGAAVAECRHLIQTQSKLPATTKAKLEDACTKAGKGDEQAVKRVASEVCEEVVSHSSVPNGPAREEALAACKK
jgi:hypothetical protein